jgi:hypothetical protein
MGCLQANSRPDITFAVSQCARFASSPRRSHELALIRVGQYLKKTADKGLILRPIKLSSSDTFKTDIFVDADFAGGWGDEDPNDPPCVDFRFSE